MERVAVLVSLVLLLIVFVVVPGLVMAGLWEITSCKSTWPRLALRGHVRLSGIAKIVVAVLIVCVPFLVAPIAESQAGWVDDDGDGRLDGFNNGPYGWLEVNGGVLTLIWATCTALVLLAAAQAGRWAARTVGVSDVRDS